MLILLDDLLLNYSSLEIIRKAYLKKKEDFLDPFVSPFLISDEILKLTPFFRVYVGSDDPLYDDSVRFVHRASVLGMKCGIVSFDFLGHGLIAQGKKTWLPGKVFFERVIRDISRFVE